MLLEYLVDVREGLADRSNGDWEFGSVLALMCEAWNAPAYQELERLLPYLRDTEPRRYWHLAERYLRYGEVRVAHCRRCGHHHASQIGSVHRHPPGRAITLKPVILRSLHKGIDELSVSLAIDWLEDHFHGEVALPKAVLEVESERRLRAVA